MTALIDLARQLQHEYEAGNLLDMQDVALVLGVTNSRIAHLTSGRRTAPSGETLPSLKIGYARFVIPADLARLWPDKPTPGLEAFRAGAWAAYVQSALLPDRRARFKSKHGQQS